MTPEASGVKVDPGLVAFCGLYCASCGAFRKGRCPGCAENAKATWCKVRSCCREHGWQSCADCTEHADPKDCRLFDSWIAGIIGVVMNSDRRACILKIREIGRDRYAAYMAEQGRQTIPRRGSRAKKEG